MKRAIPLLFALAAAPVSAQPAAPACPAVGAPEAAKLQPAKGCVKTSAAQNGQTLREAASVPARSEHAINTKGTGATGRSAAAGGEAADCDDASAALKDAPAPAISNTKTSATQNGQVLRTADGTHAEEAPPAPAAGNPQQRSGAARVVEAMFDERRTTPTPTSPRAGGC